MSLYTPKKSGMYPTWRRTPRGSLITEQPPTQASPLVGRSRVVRMRMVVVLPAPLGPTKPKTEPSSTLKETSRTAVSRP